MIVLVVKEQIEVKLLSVNVEMVIMNHKIEYVNLVISNVKHVNKNQIIVLYVKI